MVHITTDFREEHNNAIKLAFKTTNNKTKYEALLAGLLEVEMLGATKVEVRVDSHLVFNQVLGEFIAKGEE